MAKLRVGDGAPDFELQGTGDRTYRLERLPRHGRDPRLLSGRFHPGLHPPVLLLPRRRRPARSARRADDWDLPAVGRVARAASPNEHGLNVPLLSDPGKKVARAYGVVGPGGFIRRSVFLIDGEGVLRYRHVALFGLRYQDVGDLERAVADASLTMADVLEPSPFEVDSTGATLAGEEVGEGPPSSSCTGSRRPGATCCMARWRWRAAGYRQISYDARGHGESSPAPEGSGYGYDGAGGDLRAVIGRPLPPDERPVLAGTRWAATRLSRTRWSTPDEVAALVLAGPGRRSGCRPTEESLADWDALGGRAGAGRRRGVHGGLRGGPRGGSRLDRDRPADHPGADGAPPPPRGASRGRCGRFPGRSRSRASRSWRRSTCPPWWWRATTRPIPGIRTRSPRPGPSGCPRARLVSEEPGKSPLAWQGGRLSRVIADFLEEPQVRERLT